VEEEGKKLLPREKRKMKNADTVFKEVGLSTNYQRMGKCSEGASNTSMIALLPSNVERRVYEDQFVQKNVPLKRLPVSDLSHPNMNSGIKHNSTSEGKDHREKYRLCSSQIQRTRSA